MIDEELYGDMTPADSKGKMDEIAGQLADKTLAYSDPGKHKRLTKEMEGLARRISPDSPVPGMNYESLITSARPQTQADLISAAEKEMDRLEELGFSRDEIPGDLREDQLDCLKMQRLNAEGNFSELTPVLERHMVVLGFKGMDAFRGFIRDSSVDPAMRQEHIDLILQRIYEAYRRKEGE